MGIYCCVKNCNNRLRLQNGRRIAFHNFPREADLRLKWLKAVRRLDLALKRHIRVCSDHFLPSDYFETVNKLKKNTVPTVFSWSKNQTPPTRRVNPSHQFINNQYAQAQKKEATRNIEQRLYTHVEDDSADRYRGEDDIYYKHLYPEVIIREESSSDDAEEDEPLYPEVVIKEGPSANLDFSDSYNEDDQDVIDDSTNNSNYEEEEEIESDDYNMNSSTAPEKLHQCNICNKSFNRNYNLKRHIKTHFSNTAISIEYFQ